MLEILKAASGVAGSDALKTNFARSKKRMSITHSDMTRGANPTKAQSEGLVELAIL